MQQAALLPAGCAPWSKSLVAASPKGDRFAYCSTLAIYVYDVVGDGDSTTGPRSCKRTASGHVLLSGIFAEHTKNISAMCWHPTDENIIASISVEGTLLLWDVKALKVVETMNLKSGKSACWLGWGPGTNDDVPKSNRLAYFEHGSRSLYFVSHDTPTLTIENNITAASWNPRGNGIIILGDVHNIVYICRQGYNANSKWTKQKIQLQVEEEPSAGVRSSVGVVAIKWDPLSENYFMAALSNGRMILCDANSGDILSSGIRQGGVSSFEWLCNNPGAYVTADQKSGVLRTWNVASASTPLQIHTLLPSPILTITAMRHTIQNDPRFANASSKLPDTRDLIIVAFGDGSIGLYNTAQNRWVFLRDRGHVETIFGCDFKDAGTRGPLIHSAGSASIESRDGSDSASRLLLATASFDGTIKIWDVGGNDLSFESPSPSSRISCSSVPPTNKLDPGEIGHLNRGNLEVPITCIDSFPTMGVGQLQDNNGKMALTTAEGAFYSVSWAPGSVDMRLVTGSSNGTILVYDTAPPGRVVAKYSHLHWSNVYRVVWNPHLANGGIGHGLVASASDDCTCNVFNPDNGISLKSFTHPGKVFGCDWSPFESDRLATTCMDGNVRIYSISSPSTEPTTVLSGHTARTFNVAWSPLIKDLLASGSDDKEIRIWNVETKTCIMRLEGHTKFVRGLAWHLEASPILFSGSWDSTIRIWDVRTGACIHVAKAHQADVYAIATHPSRPMMLASASRDSTLRLWNLDDLVREIRQSVIIELGNRCLAGDSGSVLGSVEVGNKMMVKKESSMLPGPIRFCGRESLQLVNSLEKAPMTTAGWKMLFRFFSLPGGAQELWDMVSSLIKDPTGSSKCPTLLNWVKSRDDVAYYYELKAQKLERSVDRSSLSGMVGSKTERIRAAAELRIRLGQPQSYCEAMISLGEWEKALSIAPAVGYQYWVSLASRYADDLANKGSPQAVAYHLATGNAEKAIDFSLRHGDDTVDSALIAQVHSQNGYQTVPHSPSADYPEKEQEDSRPDLFPKVANVAATRYAQIGSCLFAATCRLAAGDKKAAYEDLLHGGQYEHAYALACVFGMKTEAEIAVGKWKGADPVDDHT